MLLAQAFIEMEFWLHNTSLLSVIFLISLTFHEMLLNLLYEKVQSVLLSALLSGGDQGVLNGYFSDWATADIRKHLPFIYNMSSIAIYTYLPAFKQ